jgi:hypothetical protein
MKFEVVPPRRAVWRKAQFEQFLQLVEPFQPGTPQRASEAIEPAAKVVPSDTTQAAIRTLALVLLTFASAFQPGCSTQAAVNSEPASGGATTVPPLAGAGGLSSSGGARPAVGGVTGSPVHAVGAQAHDAYKLSTNTVQGYIDKIAAETALPVYITEYDIDIADDNQQRSDAKPVHDVLEQREHRRDNTLGLCVRHDLEGQHRAHVQQWDTATSAHLVVGFPRTPMMA